MPITLPCPSHTDKAAKKSWDSQDEEDRIWWLERYLIYFSIPMMILTIIGKQWCQFNKQRRD